MGGDPGNEGHEKDANQDGCPYALMKVTSRRLRTQTGYQPRWMPAHQMKVTGRLPMLRWCSHTLHAPDDTLIGFEGMMYAYIPCQGTKWQNVFKDEGHTHKMPARSNA
eukprot:872398-Pelagomonas_calceolata.AAC.2